MTEGDLHFLYDMAQKYQVCAEIGSWAGKSAHALLSGCKGIVHCIDHFQGSANPIETGNRDVVPDFMNNVGSFNNLSIHRMSNIEALSSFKDRELDMLFIDGGHMYHEVVEDITNWYPKIDKMICGHDIKDAQVSQAVYDTIGPTCRTADDIWWLELNTINRMRVNIKQGINFSFIKRGDGEELCMNGAVGANCDGHAYSAGLGLALSEAYSYFSTNENIQIVLFDDQRIYNSLLHRPENMGPDLYTFYHTIKTSPRKKVFIGPTRLGGVINFLNISEYHSVPLTNSYNQPFDIVPVTDAIYLFCAGMPAKVWMHQLLQENEDITCIDLGSAMDPLFVGQTRTDQTPQHDLLNFYKDML
jgi:hypothetical protein